MTMDTTIAQPLAPEDIVPGQYITPLVRVQERFPNLYSDDAFVDKTESFRITFVPHVRNPVRVLEVCLPFVLIETPKGKTRMLDLRRYRLARVSDRFGEAMFARAQTQPPVKDGNEEKERDEDSVSKWFE